MNYWDECVKEAFEDAGIKATKDQIDIVISWVEGAHDNYGMSHGHDCIPNPLYEEIDSLKAELKKERNKQVCRECNGRGLITNHGPVHSATSQCWNCRGEGKK